MTSDVERRLREHFDTRCRVPPLAVDLSKALFGLRRLDEELVELRDETLAMRGSSDPEVLRFELRDAVLVVRRTTTGVDVVVSPPSTTVWIESAAGSEVVALDTDGAALVTVTGPARFRIELPDGTSGVTDAFDLTPT